MLAAAAPVRSTFPLFFFLGGREAPMKRLSGVVCAVVIWACALSASAQVYYGDFDWRRNGGNFVTPIRNQGSAGTCWAFGATAALESRFLINAGTPGLNLNLSEQNLVCEGSMGDTGGGYEFKAASYFVSHGITTEAELPYTAQDTSPLWPLTPPYTLYKTTSVANYISGGSTTAGIKNWLASTGPLITAIHTNDWFTPTAAEGEAAAAALDFSTPEWLQGSLGAVDPLGGINHAVCIVGYKDVSGMPEGGYWIVKNSWGASWGDHGYGFFKYGDIEKHNRTHAVTGSTYTVDVPPPNYAPVAVDDVYSGSEDDSFVVYAHKGILVNDTDQDTPHENLTASQLTSPAHGALSMGSNGWLTYTPAPNYHGTDSFTYRVYDGGLYSNTARVNLDIVSVNDVPVAADDAYECKPGETTVVYSYKGVLANDTDADNTDTDTTHNDMLSAILSSDVSHGSLELYSGGAFLYTPDPAFDGTDSFTYQVSDGTVLSNTATVLLEILAAAAPIPGDATGDGVVDGNDAARLAAHWGHATAAGAAEGDFNGDGWVNAADASILAANWGSGAGEAGSAPEPSVLAMLMMVVLGLLGCGRRL
jgi:hypothetical protein